MDDDDQADQGRRLASGRWEWSGADSEGSGPTIRGVNPWNYEWQSLGVYVELEEPAHRERYNAAIYRITVNGQWVCFASREITPGIYGFWLPTG